MSTIVDHQIRELARMTGLVEPFNPDQINPASYDVTLGTTILKEGVGAEPRWIPIDITGGVYVMQPGEFILAATEEMVRIPNNLECVFNLKSSRGREGFEHLLAGYIDPGFHGKITLELCNVNRHHRLALEPGMRIGQLRFSKLDAIPHRNYALTGRYHQDDGVRSSKG